MSDLVERLRDLRWDFCTEAADLLESLTMERDALKRAVVEKLMPEVERLTAERDAATLAERERCAKVCESLITGWPIEYWLQATKREMTARMAIECAAEIRKGEQP